VKCSTEQLQQSLSRQDAAELKSEFQSSKSATNRNTQIQKSKSKTRLFGILCFLIIGICFEFRILSFEFLIYTWRALWFDHAHHPESIEGRLPGRDNPTRSSCYSTGRALWSISPGRDNPTRSSCYSTGLAPWNILSTEALSFHSRHYFTGCPKSTARP